MQRRSRKTNEKIPTYRSRCRKIIWLTISALVLSILRFIIVPNIATLLRKPPSSEQIRQVRSSVQEVMSQYGIRDEWINIRGERQEIKIPTELRFYQIFSDIVEEVQKFNADVCSCSADLKKKTRTLEIGFDDTPVVKLLFLQRDDLSVRETRVAIIIDDFGYAFDRVTEGFINMQCKITLSIIPGQKHSKRVAQEAYHNGKEVMIHLPMEPLEESVQDLGYTIFTNQSEEQVRDRVRKAFENVPFAKGLNNHKGSKATTNISIMKPLIQVLKESGLYFIDSRTSPNSIGAKTAGEIGIPWGRRDIFIDTEDDETLIRDSLKELCSIAMKKGTAIGIGHARKKTLSILNTYLTEFEGKGIDFVYVSEIVQ